ncbi:MAG: zf-HC2 domain-containing protein [Myxococcota bacterium]
MLPTCQEITQLCTDYLERRLSRLDRLRFQLHIALCPHCRRYMKQMQATVDALGYMPADAIPTDLESELMERFKNWSSSRE